MTPSITVVPYDASFMGEWNRFVAGARNGHFLFDRGFMDYHRDRFTDSSLLFFDRERLIGVLPANRDGDTVYSHQGLTFGGIAAGDRLGAGRMLALFNALRHYLDEIGIRSLVYKPVPHIYHRRPAEEDLYALFRSGGELVRRDISAAIDYTCPSAKSRRRDRGIRKAEKAQIRFEESGRWEEYWQLLGEVLGKRHAWRPAHSIAEIELLHSRFPDQIRLFIAHHDTRMLAGVVIFETAIVAHAQYSAVSDEGRVCGALDGLFSYLIEYYQPRVRWFDFGISSEQDGRVLNEGLATQKEEFGASGVAYDAWCLSIE